MTKKIAFLTANEGIEAAELTKPWQLLTDAGYEPELIAPKPGTVQLFNHLDKADTHKVDVALADAKADDYAALVLPGGVANPDALRMEDAAVALVQAFAEAGKPVAAICHGPWVLVEAGLAQGHKLTSWPSLKTDIRNAGGTWVDQEVVVDNGVITSRNPDDIPAFSKAIADALA